MKQGTLQWLLYTVGGAIVGAIEQIPYDMTDSEIETYVNQPLRSNGITYQF